MKPAACSAALAALFATGAAMAGDVVGTDPPFRARVPDSFAAVGGTQPGVFVFASRPAPSEPPRVITLRPLDGAITQGELDVHALERAVSEISPGASVRVANGEALGVDVPIVFASTADHDAIALAQIPTEPRAIQLIVSGPASATRDVESTARDVMSSLTGSTRWLTRAQTLRRRLARTLVFAAWGALALYAIAWFARYRRSPAVRVQRIALFAIAAAFATTAGLLASVPRNASAFEPVTPALVAIVLLVNAVQLRSGVGSRPPE